MPALGKTAMVMRQVLAAAANKAVNHARMDHQVPLVKMDPLANQDLMEIPENPDKLELGAKSVNKK
jgi:hypothetical protein